MTNDPRYSPPPPQHGRGPGDDRTAVYPGQHGQTGYQQQPYDWRYATQQQRAQQHADGQHPHQQPFRQHPYDPYRGAPQQRLPQQQPPPPQKRSRAGALTVGALTIAVVSASIGGGVALMAKPDNVAGGTQITAAPSVPAASLPAGSVEQVAAKVVPSVVKLETDMGRASEEGSGIILSSDGLILTNNHVVSAAKDGPGGPAAAQTKVTFSDGRTTQFTVVGTDPSSDIAVVRAQGVSGLTPITLGSSGNLRVGQDVVAVGSPLGLEGTVT